MCQFVTVVFHFSCVLNCNSIIKIKNLSNKQINKQIKVYQLKLRKQRQYTNKLFFKLSSKISSSISKMLLRFLNKFSIFSIKT